jgi:Zn-dependent protease with chaperone function
MRWCWIVVLMGACLSAAAAEGIEQVLERSQQMRLAQRPPAAADGAAARRLRASLNRLLAAQGANTAAAEPVTMVVVGGSLLAEALLDRPGIAVSESVADLPEGERLLLLAHELGHVRLAHAHKLKALYRRHIPGEVRKDVTDAVAGALGAQAHAASHEHELQADAYGYTLARTLGFGLDNAFALLTRQGVQHGSATHPATARRLAQLRLLDLRLATEPGDGTDAQALAMAGSAR